MYPEDTATLLLALDLRRPFNEQFPAHLTQMESWQALAQTPHVCINDRTGANPAKARRDFERTAMFPPLSVAHSNEPETVQPTAPRDRSHLSLVIF
jgi:hypothetical protein